MKKYPTKKNELHERRIYKVLEEQNFVLAKKERKLITEKISNNRRYFFMVAKRKEGKKTIERFIKIPKNNTKRLLVPFERQIETVKYFKSKKIIKTRGIIAYNYNLEKGIPFVIMETFPAKHSKIGFIEKNNKMEFLGRKEAKHIIDQLIKLHSINTKTLPKKMKKLLKTYPGDFKTIKIKFNKYLNKKVRPIDFKGKRELFYKVLEKRIGETKLKQKIKDVLERIEPMVNKKENVKNTIVHGDLSPNNLYVFNSGDVEFLDLEWVGISKNKALAMVIDFGNLRARSWNNKRFRTILDQELLKYYKKIGRGKLGKAIIQLSILRSHIKISRFFENYAWKKQRTQSRRRNETEQDIKQALEH